MNSAFAPRKNFIAMTSDGALFFTALVFIDIYVLIPFFINNLTASPFLVGLAAAIRSVGFFLPQVFIAPWTTGAERLDRFVFFVHFLTRSTLVVPIIGILLGWDTRLVVLAFFIALTLFAFGEGSAQVAWMDVFGRTIEEKDRGKLFGYQQALGGFGALLGGFLVQRLLGHPSLPFPINFAWIFSIGLIFLLASALAFLFTNDPPKNKQSPIDSSAFSVIKQLPTYLKVHPVFRKMLLVQILTSFNALAFPFYILFVKGLNQMPSWMIGYVVIAQVVGTIIGGFTLGWMSDHLGNRRTIIFTITINIAVPFLILASGRAPSLNLAVPLALTGFSGLGIIIGGWLGFTNYLMETTPVGKRPIYISLSNLFAAPIAMLPILAGAVSHLISFPLLFLFVALMEIGALILALRLPEPRNEKSIMAEDGNNELIIENRILPCPVRKIEKE